MKIGQNQEFRATLVLTRPINTVPVDGYSDGKTAWFTREQIGLALGYADPTNAIAVIHKRNKERLDKFSRGCQIDTPSGKQTATLYSVKGMLEICRWSKQPKANEIMDALYDMAEAVIRDGYVSTIPDNVLLEKLNRRLLENPNLIKEHKNYRANQTYLKSFGRQKQADDLYQIRWSMTQDEYFKRLDAICQEDTMLLSRETNRYARWLKSNRRVKHI